MKKDLLDFQADWVKICDKGYHDYKSLTPAERVWYNVECLLGLVQNGGVIGFYCNSGADHVFDTINDLLILGHKDIALILEKMNTLFPNCDIENDFDGRNEIIDNSWDERHSQLLDELDAEFFQKDEDLEDTLVQYILKNKLSS